MTKTIHAALAPAILAAALGVIAVPTHAAPAHSLAPLVSEIQSSARTPKVNSSRDLTAHRPVVSQFGLSLDNAPKGSDLLAVQSKFGFITPKHTSRIAARRLKSIMSNLSISQLSGVSSSKPSDQSNLTATSRFAPSMSELITSPQPKP